jgi:soluble lytic murein transglycosylase-like protein
MPFLSTEKFLSLVSLALLSAPTAAVAQPLSRAATDGAGSATASAFDAEPTSFVLFEHREYSSERAAPTARPAIVAAASGKTDAARKPAIPNIRVSAARSRVLLHIRAAEVRHALPPGLLDAVVAAESNYRPYAVSKAGAAGLAQLMPGTARDLGVLNRFDIGSNLDGGARYLRAMLDRFGSVALALAAYNAGPRSVERARGIPANSETPRYVDRVIEYWTALRS